MSEDAVIRVRNLHRMFGAQWVLRGVDLEVPRGKTTVIIGRSGIGKSVFLKHIIGLMKPDKGEIWVDGEEITGFSSNEMDRVRRKFGMLFQNAALFDSMTVMENVSFPLQEHTNLSRQEIHEKVRERLRLVGLEGAEEKWPSDLSGGMRKRVGLARAIALDPPIILYDEPTTGLDPILCDTIDRLIVQMQEELDVTSVVISHDIEGSFKMGDRIAMLHNGRIQAAGTPEEIKSSADPAVRQFITGSAEGPIRVT
jgi:phospholipid/cholesterol/gamma-HCH transport system ATP-binding protein